MKKLLNPKVAIGVLTVLYIVGTVGFISHTDPDFPKLTPLNLVISLVIVLCFHVEWGLIFAFWCFFTLIIGFFIEVIGVSSGQIFGSYQYGETLGFKVWNTPLSIGVNWLLTAYCSAVLVSHAAHKSWHWILKSVLAALLMVSLDVLIEPIAVKTGMWTWENGEIPLQNYVGWFLTALPLQLLFFRFIKSVENKVAIVLLFLQFTFFFILNQF